MEKILIFLLLLNSFISPFSFGSKVRNENEYQELFDFENYHNFQATIEIETSTYKSIFTYIFDNDNVYIYDYYDNYRDNDYYGEKDRENEYIFEKIENKYFKYNKDDKKWEKIDESEIDTKIFDFHNLDFMEYKDKYNIFTFNKYRLCYDHKRNGSYEYKYHQITDRLYIRKNKIIKIEKEIRDGIINYSFYYDKAKVNIPKE